MLHFGAQNVKPAEACRPALPLHCEWIAYKEVLLLLA